MNGYNMQTSKEFIAEMEKRCKELNQPYGWHYLKPSTEPGYSSAVYADKELVAQFHRPGQAEKWVGFMTGAKDSKS
jgi:hypothetical protein